MFISGRCLGLSPAVAVALSGARHDGGKPSSVTKSFEAATPNEGEDFRVPTPIFLSPTVKAAHYVSLRVSSGERRARLRKNSGLSDAARPINRLASLSGTLKPGRARSG